MSQRQSGYARKEFDAYETPEWVTRALLIHIPERITYIFEPAAGRGKMVSVLKESGHVVDSDDIIYGNDFLQDDRYRQAIVTNPPYTLAEKFILKALDLTWGRDGFVAMLLRTDFDHAKSRISLFNKMPFAKKIILTKRIRWIEGSTGSPSFNHAWFCWDWRHKGPPILAYHQ